VFNFGKMVNSPHLANKGKMAPSHFHSTNILPTLPKWMAFICKIY